MTTDSPVRGETAVKQQIFDFLDQMDETVLCSEEEKDQLKAWCDELCTHTAVPEPINNQAAASGVWRSRFASFAVKHSENQPMYHPSDLARQSFNNLPKVPVQVVDLVQEIDEATKAYNNVVHVTSPAGDAKGIVVMFGRYEGAEENPQRYAVSFYRVGFFCNDDRSDEAFREAFGIDADRSLDVEFRPPSLHSDIVYLDDDARINYGKLGGFYVLSRDPRPFYSLDI
ncbi:MAG: PAP/fibrillin family protein [Pseudomonadota bacterium]